MCIPLVSTIISTYNSSKFIRGRLDDLIAQTLFKSIEIIIINSGSEQDEESIIKDYLTEYNNIKYFRTNERETIYKAWNRGIKLALGKFITNANTDDRLKENALEILVNYITDKPSVAIVYGDQYITNIPNQIFKDIKNEKRSFRPKYKSLKLFCGYMVGSQSLWRKSLHIDDNIWFNENYEVAGDYDFVCRVAEKYEIKKVNKVLGVYFKSKNKSNKEDQNLQLTHSEAANVKDIYSRRYISSLDKRSINYFECKLKLLSILPSKYWGLINRISNRFFPGYFTIHKIFICWMLSLIKEHKKEFVTAKKLIAPYKIKDKSGLIAIQLNHLLEHTKLEQCE